MKTKVEKVPISPTPWRVKCERVKPTPGPGFAREKFRVRVMSSDGRTVTSMGAANARSKEEKVANATLICTAVNGLASLGGPRG